MADSHKPSAAELEKQGEFEHASPTRLSSDHPEDINHGFSEKEQKSIIRRIDRRLTVTVGAMYCVSLMDRTNMSAANIAGMSVELNLIGFRYVRNRSLCVGMSYEGLSLKAILAYRTSVTSSSSSRISSSSLPRLSLSVPLGLVFTCPLSLSYGAPS